MKRFDCAIISSLIWAESAHTTTVVFDELDLLASENFSFKNKMSKHKKIRWQKSLGLNGQFKAFQWDISSCSREN